MHRLIVLSLAALCPVACAPVPISERPPYVPPGLYGTYEDNDIGAINQSAWAFSSPANTSGDPIDAAKAVVALEYLPRELQQNPRWIGMDSAVPLHLRRARDDLQKILGIRVGTPPQLIVNTLLALSLDLETGNKPAAEEVLASPIFTMPAAQTLRILSNLPYNREANLGTARAVEQAFAYGGSRR